MKTRFIHDMSLAQKVMIAPVILLLVIVGLGIHIQSMIGLYDGALRSMDRDVHRKSILMDGVVIDVGSAQGRLYQLINWQAAGLEAARLEELSAQIKGDLPRINASLAELDGYANLTDEERSALATAATLATEYVQAVDQVLEMALIDQSYAVMFMTSVDEGHAKLKEALETLKRNVTTRSAAIFGTAQAESSRALLVSVVAIVVALGAGTVVSLLVSRMISRPIGTMTAAMQALSRGDLGTEIGFAERRDEIGRMAEALAIFQRVMRENTALQESQRAEEEARSRRSDALDAMTKGFAQTIDRLIQDVASLADDMKTAAEGMSSAAGQATGLSLQVSMDTGQASSNVTAVASATEELTASIAEISRQVRESAELSRNAVELAKNSANMVQTLADSANRIGSIIELINRIAGQTNLLALNATIEAARAGEMGKGFAVVASEVKALARQTEHATDEITRQIASVQADAGGVIQSIASIDQTIQRMNGIAEVIAVSIDEQMSATREISCSAVDISASVSQVAENIRRVEESTAGTGRMSGHVLDATKKLSGRFDELKSEVRDFVERVQDGQRTAAAG